MMPYLKKIKLSLQKIPKHQPILFFFLFFLWLISLADSHLILSVKSDAGSMEGYVNQKKWGLINEAAERIEDVEIDIKNHNLPKPLPFKTEIEKVLLLDETGTVVYQTKSQKFNLAKNLEVKEVRVILKNCFWAEIKINQRGNTRFSFLYRPFRDSDTSLAFIKDGKFIKEDHPWRSFSLTLTAIFQFWLKIVLQPFPFLGAFFLIFLLLKKIEKSRFFNFKAKRKYQNIFSSLRINEKYLGLFISLIFLLIFFYLVWLNITYVEKIPHDPDSVAYLFGAKYLASGRLWLSSVSKFFETWHSLEKGNHWVIVFPYGHPALLALGSFFNVPWLVPPLIGTFFLILVYLFLKKIATPAVSLAIVLIGFFSPFFQMQAVNFMSHNSASFYLTFGLFVLMKIYKNSSTKFLSLAGGASFVFLYQTRPLIMVSLAPLLGLLLLFLWAKNRQKQNKIFWFAGGLILAGIILLLTNYLIYGHPISTSYSKINLPRLTILKGNFMYLHELTDSISYLLILRLLLLPGLPNLFFFLLLGSLFNRRLSGLSLLCWLSLLLVLLGTALYEEVWGFFLGCRFWYEMLPFILILIAIAFDWLIQLFKKTGYLIILLATSIIAYRSINGWILNREKYWGNMLYFTPNNITELKGLNFTDARLIKEAERQKIHNAVIFVKDCGGQWWCYGSVLNENTINFDGDIVWAKDLKNQNRELIGAYPGRKFFLADYDSGAIVPLILN